MLPPKQKENDQDDPLSLSSSLSEEIVKAVLPLPVELETLHTVKPSESIGMEGKPVSVILEGLVTLLVLSEESHETEPKILLEALGPQAESGASIQHSKFDQDKAGLDWKFKFSSPIVSASGPNQEFPPSANPRNFSTDTIDSP